MKTAVVILNWNGRGYLERFLPVLKSCTPSVDCEIIVADNASTDTSLEYLKDTYTIVLDQNYGFAGGYNRALEQVDADYFVLLNSDVEVTQGWLEPLVAILDADADIAAVMPKIRSEAEREKFEYAGASGGFIDILGYPFCRGRLMDAVEIDSGQYDDARQVFWATGACMVVRSSVYKAMGGFDESFFAHQEEIDLCWRMQKEGYRIYVEPRSVVYHIGGGTLSADSPRKTYLNFRNNLIMLYKNLSPVSLVPVMFARMCLDGLAALIFLIKGKRKMFSAVWNAHVDFYKRLPSLKRSGGKNKPQCIYRGSVVFDYYMGRNPRIPL